MGIFLGNCLIVGFFGFLCFLVIVVVVMLGFVLDDIGVVARASSVAFIMGPSPHLRNSCSISSQFKLDMQ